MNDAQKKALLLWHSWGACAPGNPVLQAAAQTYFSPVGMVFDHVQFDPSGIFEGHYASVNLVRRSFRLPGATEPGLKSLFAPLAPVSKHLKVSLADPFILSIELLPSAARDDLAYKAAKTAMEAGLVDDVNAYFAIALDGFRMTVTTAFTGLVLDETQAQAVPAFMADPVAYYHNVRSQVEAALVG